MFVMDADLLDRFLAGETSARENVRIHTFFGSHPEIRASLREFVAGLPSPESRRLDVDASWTRLERRLAAYDSGEHPIPRHTPSRQATQLSDAKRLGRANPGRSRLSLARSVALRAVLVAAAGVLLVISWHSKAVSPILAPVPAHTYTTRAGERAIIDLTDGSNITLAPNSSLTIRANFGASLRQVDLVGEGYFVVAHNSLIPFIVRAGAVTSTDLGTRFDVKHYPSDRDVRVAVVSGRVASSGSRHPGLTLDAGMVGHLTDSTATAKRMVDTAQYAGWTHGWLQFKDTPVPEVLTTLEEWYSVRFRIEDGSLIDARLSGQLDYSSDKNMLATLKTLLNVSMTVHMSGDTTVVTLRPLRSAVPTRRGRDDFHLPREVGTR